MSTKTIAVDSRVYERLAGVKREGESFSKAIDRLLSQLERAHTGQDILQGLDAVAPVEEEGSANDTRPRPDRGASRRGVRGSGACGR